MTNENPTPAELTEHLAFVRRVATALVHDPHLAEDISQEAILAALRRPPEIERDLRSWLGGVVRNLARVHYREKARRTRRERTVAESRHADRHSTEDQQRDSVAESLNRAELRQQIAQAVLALEEPYKSVLILRYMENLSPTEIASVTGRPLPTVKTQLQRGLDQLRTRFDATTGGREAWRRAFLGLLLPLPVFLATTGVAAAATAPLAGGATASGSAGTATAGTAAGGTAAGVLFGTAAWIPIVALVALTTWWAIPPDRAENPRPEETTSMADERSEAAPASAEESEATGRSLGEELSPSDPLPSGGPLLGAPPIEVAVVDESGHPIEGARITPAHVAHLGSTASVVSDQTGRVQMPAEGAVAIRVSHPDFLARTLTIDALEGAPAIVVLSAGALAAIEVIDRHSGHAIEGALVILTPDPSVGALGGETLSRVTMDSPDAPHPGAWRKSFEERTGSARSWVVDVETKLEDDERLLASLASKIYSRSLEGRTDRHGRVQLRVDPTRLASLTVSAEGYGVVEMSEVDLFERPRSIISLEAEARLRLVRSEGELLPRSFQVTVAGYSTSVELAEGETEVVIGELPAGTGYVRVNPSMTYYYSPDAIGDLSGEGAVLVISSSRANPQVELHSVGKDASLTGRAGRVTDFDFTTGLAPVAPVHLPGEGDVLRLDPPHLGAQRRAIPLRLTAGNETVIDLDAPGPAHLVCRVTPHAWLEEMRLRAIDENGMTIGIGNRTESGFTVEDLPVGSWRLILESSTGTLAARSIDIAPGKNSLQWDLPGGALTIEGLDPHAAVTLVHAEDLARRRGQADDEGGLTFRALPAGEVRVSTRPHGAEKTLTTHSVVIADREVSIPWRPDRPADVRITFRESAPLPDGLPLPPRGIADIRAGSPTSTATPPPGLRVPLEFDRSELAQVEVSLSMGPHFVEIPAGSGLFEVHPFEVRGAAPIAIDLREKVGVRIGGRRNGAPLARRTITVEGLEPGLRGARRLRLDAEGAVSIPLPVGRYRARFGETMHTIEVGAQTRQFELTF